MPLRTRLALLAILLAAFALRAANLEAQSIWGDEAFSIYTAKQPIEFVISGGADTHPPLFHFLLHYWMLAAGPAPFAVRWLPLIASMLAVAAAYALARQVDRAQHAAKRHFRPAQRHRVGADGEAGAGIVGGDAFGFGHGT